jgi:cytochrome c oxidase subunit II
MLHTLLTLVVFAQPVAAQPQPSQPVAQAAPATKEPEAQPSDPGRADKTKPAAEPTKPDQVKPESPEGLATPPAAGAADQKGGKAGADTPAGDKPAAKPATAGDPCDPDAAPAPGRKKKEMPPVPPRTDEEPGTYWMPPAASVNVDDVDWLFYGILAISIFCFAGITIAVVYFAWKYRHRPGHRAEPSEAHNDTLEITWTIIPSIVCVIIFIFGWRGFLDLNTPPKHAYEIQVVGEKWNWSFKYPSGWVDSNLHVPVNEPVRLLMRSKDVLHSFYVPAFRVKQDVIPNRYTKLWFEATTPGVYRLYCAEYCGTEHSKMKRLVVVHPSGGFQQYLSEAEQVLLDMPPVKLGKYLYETRGCNQCHTLDGSTKVGPSWKGIFGQQHQIAGGAPATVDENYIRESILDPNAKVRAGFNAVMPTFKGQLKDEQVDGLVTFIKCLK